VSEYFLAPGSWPALLVLPLLALLIWKTVRGRRLTRAVGPRLSILARDWSVPRRRTRRLLFLAATALAILALLQPVWGESSRDEDNLGVDVLVCLDVSRSMLAQDLAPSRLERAKNEIAALADRSRSDRLGLVVFAGEARLSVPLTQDRASFKELLELADPYSVERGGTDLGAALSLALEALRGQTGEHETVVLLTDGEDLTGEGLRVAEQAAQRGITLHCVGLGTALGAKIPHNGGFLRDRSGAEVVSSLDPTTLRRIAEATGGEYLDAQDRPDALIDLYESRVLPMARKTFEAEERRARDNRYQWPLLAAFLIWIVELCLGDRKH
jgi:Ca-activated chloride channel family protein